MFGRYSCTEVDKSVDVYAFGLSLYEMISKETPWRRQSAVEIRTKVLAGQRPPITTEMVEFLGRDFKFLIGIIMDSWKPDPFLRPTFNLIELIFRSSNK